MRIRARYVVYLAAVVCGGCASGDHSAGENGPVAIPPEDPSLIEFDPTARAPEPVGVETTDWQRSMLIAWDIRRGTFPAKLFEADSIAGARLVSVNVVGRRTAGDADTATYSLSPTATLSVAGFAFDAKGSGELVMKRSEKQQRLWVVESGRMRFESMGQSAELTLRGGGISGVVLGEDGTGVFDWLVDLDLSDPKWGFLVRDLWWVRGPLEVEGETLTVRIGAAGTEWMYPYEPAAYSDYNLDGVYDFATDRAAFMAAWEAEDLRADLNLDSAWDESDVRAWEEWFRKDTEGLATDTTLGRTTP